MQTARYQAGGIFHEGAANLRHTHYELTIR